MAKKNEEPTQTTQNNEQIILDALCASWWNGNPSVVPSWGKELARTLADYLITYRSDLAWLQTNDDVSQDLLKPLEMLQEASTALSELFDFPDPLKEEILQQLAEEMRQDKDIHSFSTAEEFDTFHDDCLLKFVKVAGWLGKAIAKIDKTQIANDYAHAIGTRGPNGNIAEQRLCLLILNKLNSALETNKMKYSREQVEGFLAAIFASVWSEGISPSANLERIIQRLAQNIARTELRSFNVGKDPKSIVKKKQ